jgi:hypothetical protein
MMSVSDNSAITHMTVDPELDRLYRECALSVALTMPIEQQLEQNDSGGEGELEHPLEAIEDCQSTFGELK